MNKLIKFKIVHPDGKIPSKKREQDACYDLFTPVAFDIFPGSLKIIDTGFICELPINFSAQILERSKLASQGLAILGGIIENNYRGTWCVVLFNLGQSTLSFKVGDAIGQFCLTPMYQLEFVWSEELSQTDRGESGIKDKLCPKHNQPFNISVNGIQYCYQCSLENSYTL